MWVGLNVYNQLKRKKDNVCETCQKEDEQAASKKVLNVRSKKTSREITFDGTYPVLIQV